MRRIKIEKRSLHFFFIFFGFCFAREKHMAHTNERQQQKKCHRMHAIKQIVDVVISVNHQHAPLGINHFQYEEWRKEKVSQWRRFCANICWTYSKTFILPKWLEENDKRISWYHSVTQRFHHFGVFFFGVLSMRIVNFCMIFVLLFFCIYFCFCFCILSSCFFFIIAIGLLVMKYSLSLSINTWKYRLALNCSVTSLVSFKTNRENEAAKNHFLFFFFFFFKCNTATECKPVQCSERFISFHFGFLIAKRQFKLKVRTKAQPIEIRVIFYRSFISSFSSCSSSTSSLKLNTNLWHKD